LVEHRSPKPGVAGSIPASPAIRENMFKAVKDFLNQVYLEMNKVSWPTYSELRGSTYLIIIFSFIFVVFLFAVDWLVGEIVSALL
tara:strand:+ start:254 stop:508 length:255 start_codon:yes stop_codon:yes gene_type:complete